MTTKKLEVITFDDEAELLSKLEVELGSRFDAVAPVDSDNPTHYVNNKEFYLAMKDYIEQCRLTKEGEPYPRVPEYIGSCILKIAQKLAMRPNFWQYTFKEEMVGDAVEDCLLYIRNFNPDKYKNPFGYFTQYAWNAFIRRIEEEEKKRYVRAKEIQRAGIHTDVFSVQDHDLDEDYQNSMVEFLRDNDTVVADYEEKLARRRAKEVARRKALAEEQQTGDTKISTGKLKKTRKGD